MKPARPKVTIIGGAGTVGSSAAFRLATLEVGSEIVLIDARDNLVKSHAMDLEQAAAELGSTEVRFGSWEDLPGSSIVVLSASLPERKVASRDEYLMGNLAIVQEAAGNIARRCPEAAVLVATDPVDVFTAALPRLTGMDARQFFGYSWNDTLRFRWAVARTLGLPLSEVDGMVIGEHGELQVPLFDRVVVRSQPIELSEDERRQVEGATRSWFSTYQELQSGRTSGWTSAVGIGKVLQAFTSSTTNPVPGSVMLKGEYGVSGVSLGVPARLGAGGVEEVVELALTEEQTASFRAAAEKVGAMLDSVLQASGMM